MTIWVDADACPKQIKEIICRAAIRKKHKTIFVANQKIRLDPSDYLVSVQVADGADVADDYIANHCEKNDIVITADIPLAVRIVAALALGIDPRGTIFDKNNIRQISSMRDFMQELRAGGVETGGPKSFSNKDVQKFAQSFDKLLVHL